MNNKFIKSILERRRESMKRKIFTRPVSIVLSIEMFQQIKEITDHEDIGISDYIRNAIQEKLESEKINNDIIKEEE